MKSIRSYAKVKDANKMMDQLKARCQETTETEIDFLTKMCTLRDNILAMTRQEEHPMNEALVRKQFCHTLSVGFKKDTIRLLLAPVLKKGDLNDDDMMQEVNDAVDADAENKKKTKTKSAASTNNLNVESAGDVEALPTPGVVDGNALVLQELSKISGAVMDLSGLKSTVAKLEARVNNIEGGVGNTLAGGTHHGHPLVVVWNKCKPCQDAGVARCNHCTLCGEVGHKRATCPKNV